MGDHRCGDLIIFFILSQIFFRATTILVHRYQNVRRGCTFKVSYYLRHALSDKVESVLRQPRSGTLFSGLQTSLAGLFSH